MQRQGTWRRFANLTPVFLVGIAVVVAACRDALEPKQGADEWAAAATVGMQVNSEISVLNGGQVIGSNSVSRRIDVPLISGFGAEIEGNRALMRKGRRVLINHYRGKDGKTQSVAFVLNKAGLPDFVYAFQDGVIQAIVNPTFEKYGKKFVRIKARTTFFKDGIPVIQIDEARGGVSASTGPVRGGVRASALNSVRDVAALFLPRPLYAEEAEAAGPCQTEWVSFNIATVLLAAASTALTLAAPACLIPSPLIVACTQAGAAFTAWLAAADRWNTTLDALLACKERERQRQEVEATWTSGGTSGGGSDGDYTTWDGFGGGSEETHKTVSEFIDDAISSGNYWCNDTGERCVYYAT